MNEKPLKRVIYREMGEGAYLSGYERYLFSKSQAMRYVKFFNKHVPANNRIIYIKSADRFAYMFEGQVIYMGKGKLYLTIDGIKVLYDLSYLAWDTEDTARAFRFKKKPVKKRSAPFGL